MDKFLETLFKSEVLTDDAKKDIREGIEALLKDAKEQATKDVRASLAEEYKRDMGRLIDAMDVKMDAGLTAFMKEHEDEKAAAKKLSAKAAKAITEADKRATARMNKALAGLAEKINVRLEAELKPIYEDRELERTANMRSIKETAIREKQREEKLIAKGAAMLEQIIEHDLTKFMKSIKDDLDYARQNDFGRKIFEAFNDMYENDFAKHDELFNKLKKSLSECKKALQETKKQSAEKIKSLTETAKRESAARRKLEESSKRSAEINKLLTSLKGNARAQMRQLLESAPTDKLEATFKKYRSVVTETKTTHRKDARNSLKEATLKTGRDEAILEPTGDDEHADIDISRLRRLQAR